MSKQPRREPTGPFDVRYTTFLEIVSHIRPRLHRYCTRMTGSVFEGEDVLQSALLNAYAAYPNTQIEHLERWLFGIAHNAAIDHLRRRKRERAHVTEGAEMPEIEDGHATAESRQRAAESLRTLMHLPILQRGAVILVDVLGHSLEEASVVLASTLGGTKSALHRARTRLAELARSADTLGPPTMTAEESRRLRHYVDRFNGRDFDAIRTMLAEDASVDLVAMTGMRGRKQVSNYFGNYASSADWHLSVGFVERRPAILVSDPLLPGSEPWSFMLIGWHGDSVLTIKDFRYASYLLDAALIERAE